MAQNEKSGEAARKLAGKVLNDPKSSPEMKKLAGSVLTQSPDKKKPGKK